MLSFKRVKTLKKIYNNAKNNLKILFFQKNVF